MTHTTCLDIVRYARNKTHWIFDPSNRKWYNPDEFEAEFGRHSGFEGFFAQCQVRPPQDGIDAAMERAKRTQDQATAFVARVVDYYKKH